MKPFRHDEEGAATVELALAFPLLLLVFMASMSLLWVLAARSALDHGARLGARYAGMPTAPTGHADYPSHAQVRAYVDDKVPLFDVTHVDVCYYDGHKPTTTQFTDSAKCRPGADAPNQKVVVRVRHDLPDLFGVFTTVFGIGSYQSVTGGEARVE